MSLPYPLVTKPNIELERKKCLQRLTQVPQAGQRKVNLDLRGNKMIMCTRLIKFTRAYTPEQQPPGSRHMEHFHHTIKLPKALFRSTPIHSSSTLLAGPLGVCHFGETLICQLCLRSVSQTPVSLFSMLPCPYI